jgi:hypothetical protein
MSRNPHEQDVFKQSNNEPDHRTDNGDKPIQGADANQNPALGSHSESGPQGLEQHGTDAGGPNQNHVFGKDGLRWGWTNASNGDLNHGPQQHVVENVIQDQSGADTSHSEFGQHGFSWENSSGSTTDGWSSWPWTNHHDLFV